MFCFCPRRRLPHGLPDEDSLAVRDDLAGVPGPRAEVQGGCPSLQAREEQRVQA